MNTNKEIKETINHTNFPVPNKFISNYTLYDNFDFEVISRLCQSKDVKGYYKGHVKGLLHFSNIDTRYKNKALQFIRSIGGLTDKDLINVYVNGLFDMKSSRINNYTLIDYDIYNSFKNKELFKFYCFMYYHIKMFNDCFIQTYKQLVKSTGISEPTITKYNNLLMDMGLVYHVNSGDLYDEKTNVVVNSSNFYSTSLEFATSKMENHLGFNKDNYNFKSKEDVDFIDSNTKRKATQYINKYKDMENITVEQYDKLCWALDTQKDILYVDYSDSQDVEKVKINALVERYSSCGYQFTYQDCYDLYHGNIIIRDLIYDYNNRLQ